MKNFIPLCVFLYFLLSPIAIMAEKPQTDAPAAPKQNAAPAAPKKDVTPASPKKDAAPNNKLKIPPIVKINKDVFKVGDVYINKVTKAIYLEAKVEQDHAGLEYVLVHEKGKVHESLFTTSATPSHLQLSLLLCGYEPSKSFFRINSSARIDIFVSWKKDGKQQQLPVEDWIYDPLTEDNMKKDLWYYTGSFMHNGKYVADLDGSIIAMRPDQTAMVNIDGEERNPQDLVVPSDEVPAKGTPVTIIIKPKAKKAIKKESDKEGK